MLAAAFLLSLVILDGTASRFPSMLISSNLIKMPEKVFVKSSGLNDNPNYPEKFDWREKTSCPVARARQQGVCGSCWAVNTAAVLSDMVCIQTNGRDQNELSALDIATCCTVCPGNKTLGGFWGGWQDEAMKYAVVQGVVSGFEGKGGCMPYGGPYLHVCPKTTPSCPSQCDKGTSGAKYYGRNFKAAKGEKDIKGLLMAGSVTAVLDMEEEIMDYTSGVYRQRGSPVQGSHLVKLIGWGVERGEKYWIVVNSWGPGFGLKGLFHLRRGQNDLNMEDYGVAGISFDERRTFPERFGNEEDE